MEEYYKEENITETYSHDGYHATRLALTMAAVVVCTYHDTPTLYRLLAPVSLFCYLSVVPPTLNTHGIIVPPASPVVMHLRVELTASDLVLRQVGSGATPTLPTFTHNCIISQKTSQSENCPCRIRECLESPHFQGL